MTSSQVPNGDHRQLATLRKVLAAADFVPENVLEAIGVKDSTTIKENDILLLMHRTRAGTPLDTLVRLFLVEVSVGCSALQAAISPMEIAEWVEMGLIAVRDDAATARVKLLPYQDMVIAHDLPRRILTQEGHDYVMGIGGSSTTLANLTVRRPARRALDLGAGCGFQAFLAAKHCSRVIAVDRNPRAVAMTAFNAGLNGLSGVECREGDLFHPVEGLTFDLIVSNPPFVISPESRYIYRDSGMAGDEICRKIAHEVPRYLADNGFCHILCNWAEYTDQDWRHRLRTWFDGSGCDIWVMRNLSRDVATYAATWLRHTEKIETDNLSERFAAWMAYYEQQGIERIGGGVITLRRRSGRGHWFRADDGLETMYGACGDHILFGYAAQDFLESLPEDSALLKTAFVLSPDARLVEQKRPLDHSWALEVAELHLSRGVARKGKVDPYVEQLLIRCDGSRTLGELVDDMAASLTVERERIAPAMCDMVRRLVEQGFLLPPGVPGKYTGK